MKYGVVVYNLVNTQIHNVWISQKKNIQLCMSCVCWLYDQCSVVDAIETEDKRKSQEHKQCDYTCVYVCVWPHWTVVTDTK